MPGSPIRLRKNKNDNMPKQINKSNAAITEKSVSTSSLDELYNKASLGTKIAPKDNNKQISSSPVDAAPKNVQKEKKDIGMKNNTDNKVVSKHDNAANKKISDTNINKPMSNTNKNESVLDPDRNTKPIKNTNTDANKVIKNDKAVDAEKQSPGVFSIDKEQENLRNKIMNIPEDIAPYLILEDWRDFESSRYYLTPDLEKIYNDIVNIQKIIPEIHDMGLGYLNSTLLYGPPGTGKAQPLYSKVLTPTGFKTMGSLKVGDYVITPKGLYSKILGVYPQGYKDIYEITMDDGSKCRCSSEHLWTVQTREDRLKSQKGCPIYRTVELNKMIKNYKIESDKRSNYSIDYVNRIDFEKKELLIPPYVLGALLGDGCLREKQSITITAPDNEVLKRIIFLLDDYEIKHKSNYDYYLIYNGGNKKHKRNGDFDNTPLRKALKYYGLSGLKSIDKFIPNDYLYSSSYEERLELLRGLLDTDGTSDKHSVSYSTSSYTLAKNVQELVHSLGGFSSIVPKKSSYKDKNGNYIMCHDNYNVYIQFNSDMPFLFYVKRKNDKYSFNRSVIKRFIKDIKYIGKEECQCIYIDDPSHLYITDDYIITHNTTFARYIAYKLQIPYAYISFNKLMEGIMGNTSRNINRIFKFMADQQCVFTLDEIDCIATRRGKEAEATGGELSRITITIMQELDYYRRHKVDSIIIGATNRKDMLDAALLSRFAIKHEVRPLKMKEKEEYMAGFLRDINVPFDMQNIREYCRDNSTLSQRGLEQDMTRCVAVWLMNNKEKPYIVDHIDEEGGAR